ncbi:haloacid dehalogenase type II [Marinilactibacillus sp. XAAS-LB27]|uniref:haloacid dehalogenase type II n=1 Tax=Marinilactibacillus sp. XAAS-LB27 TaxID=3114538 RepID=UPI002E181485|nr:haloacid dehalogenase type II [Marinilactibacillus sp. XAAS-LB27]
MRYTADENKTEKEMVIMIKAVLFDMNETLLNLSLLKEKFAQHFEGDFAMAYWFKTVLHSSTVLGGLNEYEDFSKLTEAALESLFMESGKELTEETKKDILGAFQELPAYDDVEKALKLLQDNELTVIAVTNSSEAMVEKQLTKAGIIDQVDHYYSVDAVKRYKPYKEIYDYVVNDQSLNTQETVMVATHDWDLFGAKKAGLKTAYIKRKNTQFNPYYPEPDFSNDDLVKLVEDILESNKSHQ